MRGIDNIGRGFIIFSYINLQTNEKSVEIIYSNIKDKIYTTFSEFINNSYIGNKSSNYNSCKFVMWRKLDYRSYDYIERLVKNKKTGIVNLDKNLKGIENFDYEIKLNYTKKSFIHLKIKNLIRYK